MVEGRDAPLRLSEPWTVSLTALLYEFALPMTPSLPPPMAPSVPMTPSVRTS